MGSLPAVEPFLATFLATFLAPFLASSGTVADKTRLGSSSVGIARD